MTMPVATSAKIICMPPSKNSFFRPNLAYITPHKFKTMYMSIFLNLLSGLPTQDVAGAAPVNREYGDERSGTINSANDHGRQQRGRFSRAQRIEDLRRIEHDGIDLMCKSHTYISLSRHNKA